MTAAIEAASWGSWMWSGLAQMGGGLAGMIRGSQNVENTVTGATGGNARVEINNNVNVGTSGLFSSIFSPLAAISTTALATIEGYNLYETKDDARLLGVLKLENCGGLSEMSDDVAMCYKNYVERAIGRKSGSLAVLFNKRFDQCFSHLPYDPCTWGGWWNSNQIWEASQGLRIDQKYLTLQG